MKLLIDAGNTRIKWALTDGEIWPCSGASPIGRMDELSLQFAKFGNMGQIWVSNVAGDAIAQQIRDACAQLSAQPHFIVAQESQCGVKNGYASPAQLGSDRWAAMIAAWHLLKGACLVVNSGTATTIDALSGSGDFIGGLILPGVALMQSSLHDATARLRAAHGKYAPFPKNTADGLYNGALQASCGAIERQHALLGDAGAPVVLSGGAGALLRDHLNLPLYVEDNLVMRGLWLISQETR